VENHIEELGMDDSVCGNATTAGAKPVFALALITAIASLVLVVAHAPGLLWAVPSIMAAVLALTRKQRGVAVAYALVGLAVLTFFAAVGVLGGGWLTGSVTVF
jgi:hypothetical protein